MVSLGQVQIYRGVFQMRMSHQKLARTRLRPPRQRVRCVLGMLSSLEVQVLRPT